MQPIKPAMPGYAVEALVTRKSPRYSSPVAEKKAIRAWQPGHTALQAAPFFGYAAFVFSACSAHGFAYGRPCGEGREPLPVPYAGLPTLHGLSPSLGRGGRQVRYLSIRSHHG